MAGRTALPDDRGEQRAREIVKAYDHAYDTRSEPTHVALGAAFLAAGSALRDDAASFAEVKPKAWQSTCKELTQCAARLDALAADLAALKDHAERAPAREPVTIEHGSDGFVYREPGGNVIVVDPNGDDHGPDDRNWRRVSADALDTLTDEQRAKLAELDDAAPTPRESSLTPFDGVFPDQVPSTLAYLRGDTDDPNGGGEWTATAVGNAEHMTQVANALDELNSRSTPAPDLHSEAREMTQTFPIDSGDLPFLDPSPVKSGGAPIPDGWDNQRRSIADLMTIATATHQHWSWSQLTTAEDCGVKYRLQRIEMVPQVPQWTNVGGSAFHAATESFDRAAYQAGGADLLAKPITPEVARELWEYAFAEQINAVAAETGLEMGEEGQHWRASRSGAENYTWWLTQGSDMLFAYVKARQGHDAGQRRSGGSPRRPLTLAPNTDPVIEWAYEHKVPGPLGDLTVKGVIDRAYAEDNGDTIMIEDLKTGRTDPEGAQLGEYAHALLQTLPPIWPGPARGRILGRFWDARRAVYSNPVDLLAEHPFDEYVYRYHAAEAQRRSGIYSPRKSSFCGGCSVRYACPIGG